MPVQVGQRQRRVVQHRRDHELQRVEVERGGDDKLGVVVLVEHAAHAALEREREGLVDVPAEGEEDGLADLAADNAILGTARGRGHDGVEDVEQHRAVLGAGREHVRAKADAVVDQAVHLVLCRAT